MSMNQQNRTHRGVPRVVRSAHQRPSGSDRARGADLRSGDRRDSGERAEDPVAAGRRPADACARNLRRPNRACRWRPSTACWWTLPRASALARSCAACAAPATSIRVADGGDEPAVAAGHRDRVSGAGARGERDQLAPGEGNLAAWRGHQRVGPGPRPGAYARARPADPARRGRERKRHAGGTDGTGVGVTDDEGAGGGRQAAAAGHRRRRVRRRRAGLPDARACQGGGARGHRRQLHEVHPGGRHQRAEAGHSARVTRPTTASPTSRTRSSSPPAASRPCTTSRSCSSAPATR